MRKKKKGNSRKMTRKGLKINGNKKKNYIGTYPIVVNIIFLVGLIIQD